ncbi:MAG TPA: T9SS type A sorting domain-containing protein [bacterium]|nr:T9SS type A sorting domain-containing protein [bacterium]HPN46209.1 T9SS type A sorting domain-containing protein [bacterium]
MTIDKIFQQPGAYQYLAISSAGRYVWIAGKNGAIMKYYPEPTGIAPTVQPIQFELHQNHPNPFSANTQFHFTLQKPGQAQVVIYYLLGRRIRTLEAGPLNPGNHYLTWDRLDSHSQIVPAGVYFYRLQNADGSVSTAKKW